MAATRRSVPRVLTVIALVVGIALGPLMGLGRSAELSSMSGSASGFAFRVVVDLSGLPDPVKSQIQSNYETVRSALPAQAQSLLPSAFPFKVDQRFIETLSELGEQLKAEALLGSGFTEAARANGSGSSDTVNTAKRSIPSADLPIVSASVGDLLASITEGPSVTSEGTLASVDATLSNLASNSVLPLDLQSAIATVTATVNDTVDTVNGTVDGLLGDVAGEYSGALTSDPLLGAVLQDTGLAPIVSDPTSLADAIQLPNMSNALVDTLATVKNLDNDSVSRKLDSGVVLSQASSKLAGINVLDMLHVSAVDLSSTSQAAGVAGSASNTSSCEIANVRLGDQNGVALDGKNLYVNGQAVPVPLGEIAGVKSQVDQVLAAAGIKVTLCDAVESNAADDGTSANQTVSAFHVEIAPKLPVAIPALGMQEGDTLFRIILDPTVETAAAAQVATTGSKDDPSLPRTGAAALATVLTGVGLAGGAFALRRRLI